MLKILHVKLFKVFLLKKKRQISDRLENCITHESELIYRSAQSFEAEFYIQKRKFVCRVISLLNNMIEEDLKNAKILIIDDEKFVRNILSDILSEKYHCKTASSFEFFRNWID